MAYPENTESEQVFTCGHLLISMRNGAANDASTTELEKLVKAIQESDDEKASGFVNLKIKVSKLKDGDTELKVDIKVTSNIPVPPIPVGIYYPDKDGQLHRTDPRQLSMLDHTKDRGDQDSRLAGVGRGPSTIDGVASRG